MGAALGPIALQHFQLDCRRLVGKHPLGAELSCHAVKGALDIEDVALGHEQAKLLSLDSSDLGLVGADGEYWNRATATKFADVVGIAVDDSPPDAGSDSGFSNLGHPRPNRLDQNGSGPQYGILNDFDKLLSLVDGVVIGVDDLNLDAESRGHCFDGDCLFGLVIVLSCGESNNYIQFVHGSRRGVPGVLDCFTG